MLPTTLQMAMLRGALAACFAQRRQRVGGLARLRDDDGQLVLADDRIAVAVLRAVVHFDRDLRQRLDQILADQAGVPRRAAGDDRDLLQRAQTSRPAMFRSSRKISSPIERDAAEDRVARGGRLLEDLLEHEVLVAALLRRDRIPQHALRRLRDLAARRSR